MRRVSSLFFCTEYFLCITPFIPLVIKSSSAECSLNANSVFLHFHQLLKMLVTTYFCCLYLHVLSMYNIHKTIGSRFSSLLKMVTLLGKSTLRTLCDPFNWSEQNVTTTSAHALNRTILYVSAPCSLTMRSVLVALTYCVCTKTHNGGYRNVYFETARRIKRREKKRRH